MNGELTQTIKPNRGLRQGDPLFLYLFTIMVESLPRFIDSYINEGKISRYRISSSLSALTLFFFADDTILFAKATTKE